VKVPGLKFNLGEFFNNFGMDLGVDFGSCNTLVYLKGRGVVIEEPTVVARQKKKRWVGLTAPKNKMLLPIAYGDKAKEMRSREPKFIEVVDPVKNGIVSDLESAEHFASYLMKLIFEIPCAYPKVFKPNILVAVPNSITNVQKRALGYVFESVGGREVTLIEEAILAVMGLELPIEGSMGVLILDVGGGKTEAAIVASGGIVVEKSIKTGGIEFDEAIINYIKIKYGMLIGPVSAERIKIASLGGKDNSQTEILRGRELESGLPKSIKVKPDEIEEAVSMLLKKIVRMVSELLDEAPPELVEDILKTGIILVGGGASIKQLKATIEEETKINVEIAENPSWSVIKGLGQIVENREILKKIKLINR